MSLTQVDEDLGQMSGLATRVVLHREHHVFGDVRFERLAGISASHIRERPAGRPGSQRRTGAAVPDNRDAWPDVA